MTIANLIVLASCFKEILVCVSAAERIHHGRPTLTMPRQDNAVRLRVQTAQARAASDTVTVTCCCNVY